MQRSALPQSLHGAPMGPHGLDFETKLGTGGFPFQGPWGFNAILPSSLSATMDD
jgi:hypothetical protein